MFVAVSKSRGIEYVFIRDYRTDPDGRRRQVTVKSLGRKDALMAQDPDFLTKLRNRYREESEAERKRDMRAAAERFINEFDLNDEDVISEKPAPEPEKRSSTQLPASAPPMLSNSALRERPAVGRTPMPGGALSSRLRAFPAMICMAKFLSPMAGRE